ncbi:hypothetical protein B0O99DRAFT_636143, partial [Bisporella sp. PMI_857]
LGSHDIILGRNFFDYFRILINVHYRQLQTIATYTRNDMLRRDKAIAKNDKRRLDGIQIKTLTVSLAQALPKKDCLHVQAVQAVQHPVVQATQAVQQLSVQQNSKQPTLGKSSSATASQELTRASAHGSTWARETSKSLKIIANELSRPYDYRSAQELRPKDLAKARGNGKLGKSSKLNKLSKHLDIKMISGNGFMLNARQQRIELFSISLDGLERIIEDRKQEQQPVKPEALKSIVPSTYHSRLAFFSKQESDTCKVLE